MSGKHGVREINTASKGQEHNSRLDPFTTWQILLGGSEITHSKDNRAIMLKYYSPWQEIPALHSPPTGPWIWRKVAEVRPVQRFDKDPHLQCQNKIESFRSLYIVLQKKHHPCHI